MEVGQPGDDYCCDGEGAEERLVKGGGELAGGGVQELEEVVGRYGGGRGACGGQRRGVAAAADYCYGRSLLLAMTGTHCHCWTSPSAV